MGEKWNCGNDKDSWERKRDVGTPKAYRKNRKLWEGQSIIGERWNSGKYKR